MKAKILGSERVVLTLSDGRKVACSFVKSEKGNKFFIKTPDNRKELCLNNFQARELGNFEKEILQEVNDYMTFLKEQAKLEFPDWVEKNGRNSSIVGSSYTVEELRGEWKSMKSFFGRFRLAAECGFFSDKHPLKGKTLKAIKCYFRG